MEFAGCLSETEKDYAEIKEFAAGRTDFRVLILALNTNIIHDWHQKIENSLSKYKDKIEVHTYAYMVRNRRQINA